MSKTASVYVRLDPKLKADAESVLGQLGLSASAAINLFYTQIVRQKALPFRVALDSSPDISSLTQEQIFTELALGMKDVEEGRTRPADDVFNEILENR